MFYRNEHIERKAAKRLFELARRLGQPLTPPVPVDRLAEDVLGLNFLWDDIEELPGETIFGGLDVDNKLVVLNARRMELFQQKPGLERSTKGHELGHWDLFVDRTMLDQKGLPGFTPGSRDLIRRSSGRDVAVLADHIRDPNFLEVYYHLQLRADTPDQARSVNRYAAAIAMPRDLIRAAVAEINVTRWTERYRLANRFDVTISALNVRLDQLKLSYVADRDHLYRSKHEAFGQMSLDGFGEPE